MSKTVVGTTPSIINPNSKSDASKSGPEGAASKSADRTAYFKSDPKSADRTTAGNGKQQKHHLTSSTKVMLQLIADKNTHQITKISEFKLGERYIICCFKNQEYHGKVFSYDPNTQSLYEIIARSNKKDKKMQQQKLILNLSVISSILKDEDSLIVTAAPPTNLPPLMG